MNQIIKVASVSDYLSVHLDYPEPTMLQCQLQKQQRGDGRRHSIDRSYTQADYSNNHVYDTVYAVTTLTN
jgi:hypothetical protein